MQKKTGRKVDPPRSIDVAALAGVSRSAVSRTFTKGASVSPATREKVMRAAEALGYRPNMLARTLITRRSGIVGLVISDVLNPFYAGALEALSRHLQDRDFSPLLFCCRDARHLDELIPKVLSYQVDGVVIAAATLSSTMARECAKAGRPVVLVNRYTDSGEASSVACDNVMAGRMAAEHLLAAGRRAIAFIAGLENTSSSRDRELGLTRALAAHGLAPVARESGNYAYNDALDAARRILSRPQRPDAIFCANDVMALAVLDVARSEFGLETPRDLAVVGVDNISAAAWPSYALTTVDQNVERMSAEAISVLIERIDDHASLPVRRLIQPSLCIRDTA